MIALLLVSVLVGPTATEVPSPAPESGVCIYADARNTAPVFLGPPVVVTPRTGLTLLPGHRFIFFERKLRVYAVAAVAGQRVDIRTPAECERDLRCEWRGCTNP